MVQHSLQRVDSKLRWLAHRTFNVEELTGNAEPLTVFASFSQELAVRADVFLGTYISSITGEIIQERQLHGKAANSTYYFPR
jgi:hypothetical protein